MIYSPIDKTSVEGDPEPESLLMSKYKLPSNYGSKTSHNSPTSSKYCISASKIPLPIPHSLE
jgi:hypothetical protein